MCGRLKASKALGVHVVVILCVFGLVLSLLFGSWSNVSDILMRDHKSIFEATKPRSQYNLRGGCIKQLPKALIIGAPKCGTAALSVFLSFHPDIAIDGHRELHFFSMNYDLGYDWYKENLPCVRPGQLLVERSSSYIRVDRGVVERVWDMDSELKLILVVCEPVKRAISHYAMMLDRRKIPNITFEQLLFSPPKEGGDNRGKLMVINSNYSLSFSSWLRMFPFEQFHIVDGDNLKTNPWQEVSATEQFFGLGRFFNKGDFVYNATKGFYCFNQRDNKGLNCLTPTKGRKHPEVKENVKTRLHSLLKPYNELFYKLSKRRFDW